MTTLQAPAFEATLEASIPPSVLPNDVTNDEITREELLDALNTFAARWANKLQPYNSAQHPIRRTVVKRMIGQPLDQNGEPLGEAFDAYSCDISREGIGFISPDPLNAGLIAMSFAGDNEMYEVEISGSEQVGPFFSSGGKFLKRPVSRDTTQEDDHEHRLRTYQLALLKLVQQVDTEMARSSEKMPKV